MSKEIGERIRKLRILKRLNQQDMGDKLGITPSAYAKIERGETDPSASRLFQLAAILKVDIMVLLKDDYGTQSPPKKDLSINRQEFDELVTQVGAITRQLEKLNANLNPIKKHKKK